MAGPTAVDTGWVFIDTYTERDEDPLVRSVRQPAADFESGLILTLYGKVLRWGPGWWLDHPTGPTALRVWPRLSCERGRLGRDRVRDLAQGKGDEGRCKAHADLEHPLRSTEPDKNTQKIADVLGSAERRLPPRHRRPELAG